MSVRFLTMFLLSALAGSACGRLDPLSSGELAEPIRRAAQRAKERGKSTTAFSQQSARPLEVSLNQLASEYTAVVGTILKAKALLTSQRNLETWTVLEEHRRIEASSPVVGRCLFTAPELLPRTDRVHLIPLQTGSVTVDGVVVSFSSRESRVDFREGQSYLIYGFACPGGVFRLASVEFSAFAVDEAAGSLRAAPWIDLADAPPFYAEALRAGIIPARAGR